MITLAPCPCGKVPPTLFVRHLHEGEVLLSPGCCNKWKVLARLPLVYEADLNENFSAHYYAAWNSVPRGEEKNDTL